MSKGICLGIIELVKKKRLSAVSCITNSKYFNKFSNELANYKKNIDIGLHLTLTDFPPLGSPETLTHNQKFINFSSLLKKSTFGTVLKIEIYDEIEKQLDRFEEKSGKIPDFIDGHHHVHQIPIIFDILLDVLIKRYKKNRPYIRSTYEPFKNLLNRNFFFLKSFFISFFGKRCKDVSKNFRFLTNSGFTGIYDFSTKNDYRKLYETFTKKISNNHLIMCHPGYIDQELKIIDKVTFTRQLELEYLLSKEFISLLESREIKLGKFNKKIDL